jgi:Yip1-like protein
MPSVQPLEPAAAPARLSPLARAGRIFARPATAWDDLVERGQWAPPLFAGLALWLGLQALLFHRATVPMMLDAWTDAVASGRMEQSAMDKIASFFTDNPAALWIVLGQQAIVWPILVLLTALVVWFGGGFVLGTKLRYRQALDVVCWAGIVKWPSLLLVLALAWQKQTFKGLHLGLGALIPEGDTPDKLRTGITTFLDFLGPFEAWWVAVVVIGAAAITGAPRRNVAWVFVALYLAFGAFMAAVNALFNPGA